MNRWAKRYREAEKSLTALKSEIESLKPDLALKLYLERKETELHHNKIQLKFAHMQKINSIYNLEFEHWKEMANTGFALLNQFYLLLRSAGTADKEMQEQIAKLYKLCQGRQKVVKFLEEEVNHGNDKEHGDLSLPSITDSPPKVAIVVGSSSKKRPISDSDVVSRDVIVNKMPKISNVTKKPVTSGTFVKPKAKKCINFNSILKPQTNFGNAPPNPKSSSTVFKVPTITPIQTPTHALNETHTISDVLNSTFDMEAPTTAAATAALTENAFNIKDGSGGKFGKLHEKTKNKLIERAGMTLNKENKKHTPKKIVGKAGVKCKF